VSYPVYYVEENDTLYHLFDSFDGGTGASATLSGLAVTDIAIFKDGSVTQRASDSGYALLDTDGIDFDGNTGINGFSIDLSDNTTAGFYTVGPWYHVMVGPVTIDAQTVNFVACAFRIVSATRGMAGTALPAVAAEAAGGLFTRGTGAGQINQAANGMIDTSVVRLSNDAQSLTDLKDFADAGYDPATNKVEGVKLTDTLTTYTGNTPQTADHTANISAILTDTGTTLDNHLTDIKGTAFVKDTHSLVNIEGYVDLIDDGTSGLAKIATDAAAALADTNELQTDWADGGRLDLLLDGLQTSVDAISGSGSVRGAGWVGEFAEDATFDFKFNTYSQAGALITLVGTPVVSVYKTNNTTETTTGPTLPVDFDTRTGCHNVRMDLSDAFYATGSDYYVAITTGTVDGDSVVGAIVGSFSIEHRFSEVNVVALNGGAQSLLDLKDFADDGYDPSTNKVQGLVLADTVTTLTGHTAQTGDSYAIVNSGTFGNSALKTLIDTMDTVADAIKAKTDSLTFTTANQVDATTVTNSDKSDYALSSAGVDAILDTAIAEPSSMFAWGTCTMRKILQTLGALARNKITSDSNSVDVRNDADSATIWSYGTSDDATTFTSGEGA
jgi:hypothetical protein